ncbi:hypothetical protein [Mangrovibacillus cuniculi]|uniref:Uncharacterized protein n=1 Tax=Mangrovibacillus cuniculi TaxID=2593652 RepID=A0A7S8HGJ6_9BACI|nr:hypothetical protein [Mangrovibacillus cuniculi]QPC47616.1 hypothetical protein G8O30_11965 [Mangrovibacillus cuniculi]
MNKKKIAFILLFAVLLLISLYFLTSRYSSSGVLPKTEQLVEDINVLFPEVEAEEIQDIIFLDNRHVVVPFISEDNQYGVSYWAWENFNWKVLNIRSKGDPELWMLDKKDPSTYHIVWNIHPDDEMKGINFYLTKDRQYRILNGVTHQYGPKVFLEEKVDLEGKTYGVKKFTRQWSTTISEIQQSNLPEQHSLFFGNFSHNLFLYQWVPVMKNGPRQGLPISVNGSDYSTGQVDTEFVNLTSQEEIDRYKMK